MNRSGMSDNRILSGDISHAYIIEGPAGSERTEFVKKTVQALLCEDRGADHVKP